MPSPIFSRWPPELAYNRNMQSTLDIAETLVAKFHEEGESLTQLKLQKLLYYVKGWSVAAEGVPRFNEQLEAWKYGPLAYSVRQAYGRFGRGPLVLDRELFPPDDLLIDTVLDVYGAMDAEDLLALTHLDAPWQINYRPTIDRNPIPDSDIAEFFRSHKALDNPVHARFHDLYAARKFGVGVVEIRLAAPTDAQKAGWEGSLGL